MDVLPLPVPAVPHAGLLRLHGARHAGGVHVLGEADVGDARRVFPDEVDVWVQEDGVHRLVAFGQGIFKIKAVKIVPFHEVSQSLGLE